MRSPASKKQSPRSAGWPRTILFLLVLLALVILAAAWRWTPLAEWLEPRWLYDWIIGIDNAPARLALVMGGFVIGGFLMLPVSLLVLVTALVFGPWWGFLYSWIGAAVSAAAGYGAGHLLGHDTVRRMGHSVNRVSQKLARKGIVAIFLLQLLPIAPFTIGNLVAGASHIRFRDFMLGTVTGIAPGTLALSVFAVSLLRALTDPDPRNLILLTAALLILGALIWAARRWLLR